MKKLAVTAVMALAFTSMRCSTYRLQDEVKYLVEKSGAYE